MNALLIAGTDTDAGKTVLTSALAAYWCKYRSPHSLGIFKPVQSGVGDREFYQELFDRDPEEVNPLRFEAPLAPPIAAEKEGRWVEIDRAWQAFERMCQQREFVLVEGAGGLGTPLSHEMTVADLAWDWRLPTVLVVPVRLGAIAQAVANVALARQCNLHLKGIVLNCVQPCTKEMLENLAPTKLIQTFTSVPVLGVMPSLADPRDRDKLAQAASNLDLEYLLPI